MYAIFMRGVVQAIRTLTIVAFATSSFAGTASAAAHPSLSPAQTGPMGSASTLFGTRAMPGPVGRMLPPPAPQCLGNYNPNFTAWVETSMNPVQWSLEEYAPWCAPLVLLTCTGSLFICQLDYWVGHVGVCRNCYHNLHSPSLVVPSGPTGSPVLQGSGNAYKRVADLQIPSGSAAIPVAVAVNATTLRTYVSVTNPGATAGVLVYPPGSSVSTAFLTDKTATTAGAGVTVDKKGNVFWAFDDSADNGHIDEFVGGRGRPKRLRIVPNGVAGDIQIDRKGDLVVSEPSQQSIAIYSLNGSLLGSFGLTGFPSSVDLDAENANIYVADTTNNLIDQYAYPSGKLISSNPPPAINGVTPVLAAVTAPQK